jgi:hypothetical protein
MALGNDEICLKCALKTGFLNAKSLFIPHSRRHSCWWGRVYGSTDVQTSGSSMNSTSLDQALFQHRALDQGLAQRVGSDVLFILLTGTSINFKDIRIPTQAYRLSVFAIMQ